MKPIILAGFIMVMAGGAMGQTREPDPDEMKWNGSMLYLRCNRPEKGMCKFNVPVLGEVWVHANQVGAFDTADYSWRLITQTYGGRIDIRKGLTPEQCEHDRLKALNQPADDEERAYAKRFEDEDRTSRICTEGPPAACIHVVPQTYTITSSDIRRAICQKQQQ